MEKDAPGSPPGGRRSRLPGDGGRPLERIDGVSVAIVGLGASGRAAARLALERGGEVYVTDLKVDAETAAAGDELQSLGARVELGDHRLERLVGADAVVVSPGIPPDAPVLRGLGARGVRWISELEFAFRFFTNPLIAVTGTNGKTTTAALTAHLLEEAGQRVGLGGNIGAGLGPAASELARMDPAPDRYVVEASSFQLADVEWFRPDVGVVTNLAPDHLDRYPDVDAYYADKARLFDNATSRSHWVLNGDDPAVRALPGDAPGERYLFSLEEQGGAGKEGPVGARGRRSAYVRSGTLTLRPPPGEEEEPLIRRGELSLLGSHNVANALAAALSARLSGAGPGALARGLGSFRPLPHRLEPVAERGGVLWVNDSKATNVSAAISAVRSLDRPLVLLLGGKDKGEDFGRLRSVLEARVRRVVAYGEARERIADALEEETDVIRADGSFEDAVAAAAAAARRGDAILLAPACSSFDMFESYEARGRRFSELAGEEGS